MTANADNTQQADQLITGLTARPVVVPMKRSLHTASGAIDSAALVLIDLTTSSGEVGRSYLFAIGNHNLKPIVELLNAMGAFITGEPVAPLEIERLLRKRYSLTGVHNLILFGISGIDMALWDALAKSVDKPLVSILGGRPQPVKAYNSCGLGIMPPDQLADEAVRLIEHGFSAVKLRLGREHLRDDIIAVQAVKKALGPDITLMCDFNQGLTVNEAIRRGRALDREGGLYWLEEPVCADDFNGNRKIREAIHTPLQLGENFMGPEQMARALAHDCCDFVMPDVQRISGVSGWLRAAALAEAYSVDMSSHLFPEFSRHLLAVTATRHWLEYVDWADPILDTPVQIDSGHVLISNEPGAGIRWNEKAVARYTFQPD